MQAPTDAATTIPRAPADHPLVRKADEVFDRTSPYEGNGLRNHSRRLFHFASMLVQHRGLELDPALAYFIAMIHDLGLVSEQDQGVNYLRRSLALFHRETRGMELPEADPELIEQCIVYNHRVLPVPGLAPVAECFRNAVMIEHSHGLLGHSDADALLHAITDALLGAAALGDIGRHFPDTDPAFRGADSSALLAEAARRVRAAGWGIVNVDSTIVAQAPKMAPHIGAMRVATLPTA